MSLDILFVLVLSLGWTFGRLAESVRLPGILGMTLAGVALSAVLDRFGFQLPESFVEIEPFLKGLALIIILLRAGLGISRRELNQAGIAAALMSFLPCVVEGGTLTALFHFLLGWDVYQAGMAGFMLAAVSPAVVVPSMLELKAQGKETRGVITTVLAGASADDVFAITFFTAFATLARGGNVDPIATASGLPLSILGGVVLGLVGGLLLAFWFHRHHERLRATEKSLLLLLMAMALVRLGDLLHLAALLGVMVSGFLLLERAPRAAHEIASKLGKVWVVAQILLFVLIGLALRPEVAFQQGPAFVVILLLGLVARSLGVLLALVPTRFTFREKVFCVIAYWPKATVQAALGGVALAMGLSHGQEILAVAVTAILLTAPLGLIGIRLFAARLLG